MPTYDFECGIGHCFERFLPLSHYDEAQRCACGSAATKVFLKPPMGFVQRDCVYDSPIDGRPITSWAQRREDLARNGCQEYDPEMKKDAARFRAQQDAKLERAVDETVEETIEKMPSRKKELLERELSAGADIDVVRSTRGD